VDLLEETQRLIGELEESAVPYALAGAIALAVHGAPRATTDIDLLVRAEDLDAARGVAHGCGFVIAAMPMRFSDGMEIARLTRIEGDESLTVDFLIVNPQLEAAWASRERRRSATGEFWVVSREALIQMKAWANRPQDVADIQRLMETDR
jgi:hypothetical protein